MSEIHKKGQGVLVRRVAFWTLTAVIVWGAKSLYNWLIGHDWAFFKKLLLEKSEPGYTIPIFDQRFDVAFVLTWAIAGVAIWALFRWLNREKAAEFLVETDAELHKVTWPSWKDAWGSSVIVLVFVVLLTVFLVTSDKVIGTIMNLIMRV